MKNIAVIGAHPDDETLWCGGTLMEQKNASHFIISLCRQSDHNRAPKFYKALDYLKAKGTMGNLDDGPEQNPLNNEFIKNNILELLPPLQYELMLTHNPSGEYTRHRRHEEVSRAVIELWSENRIYADKLWTFAYEDDYGRYYPKAQSQADIQRLLPEEIWKKKYHIITEIYGFDRCGFEAKTTPRTEAFWEFTTPDLALQWLHNGGVFKEEN